MQFDLSDSEWALIEPLLPKSRRDARVDDRQIINGVLFVLRTGTPWRDLPGRYGPYTTVYNRFNRWSRRGVWTELFQKLTSRSLTRSVSNQQHYCEEPSRGEIHKRGRKISIPGWAPPIKKHTSLGKNRGSNAASPR